MSRAPEAPLESPLGSREGPRPLPNPVPGPFELFGLSMAFAVDPEDLRRRLVQLSRWLHPDFFGGPDQTEERALAEHNTAELNAAYDVLVDDPRRADWFVRHLGGPAQDGERQMPAAFLAEVMEWNEVLEEAREAEADTPAFGALDQLAGELDQKRAETLAAIGSSLTPLPARGSAELTQVRRLLNATRYLDRTLQTIKALRLERANRVG